MRLTCPNCSARYEVDDSMIPPEGRDVQCSNCATTWFQPGRRTDQRPTAVHVERGGRAAAEAMAAEQEPVEAEAPAPAAEPEPTPVPEPEPDPAVAEEPPAAPPAPEPEPEVAETPEGVEEPVEDTPEAEPETAPPRQRRLDPAVRDILREEAEREARLRRAEADPVETQAEMPLEDSIDQRVRNLVELDDAEDVFDDPSDERAGGNRRDLLPDIEEINSTLRSTGDRSAGEESASDIDTLETAPRRRRGTRIGFLLVLILAAFGALVYANAPQIGAAFPQAEGAVEGFVNIVNSARFWLDDIAQNLAGDAG